MSDVAYVSEVRIETRPGGDRAAHLPAAAEPVVYGLHGPIARHYGVPEGAIEERTSTIDHLVAAIAGCLAGTFSGALRARKIDASGLRAEVRGEVEVEGKVLVLKRVHVAYAGLSVADEQRETVDRVLGFHADGCPVARSVRDCVAITTSLA